MPPRTKAQPKAEPVAKKRTTGIQTDKGGRPVMDEGGRPVMKESK